MAIKAVTRAGSTCEVCSNLVVQLCDEAESDDWCNEEVETETMPQVDREFLFQLALMPQHEFSVDYGQRNFGARSRTAEPNTIRFPGPPTDIGPLGSLDSFHIVSKIGIDAANDGSALLDAARAYGRVAILTNETIDQDYVTQGKRVLERARECGWNEIERIKDEPHLRVLQEADVSR